MAHLCFFLFRGGVAAPFAAIGVVAGIPGLLRLLGLLLNPLFLTALRRFTLVAPMDNWDYPIWECWLIGLGWLCRQHSAGPAAVPTQGDQLMPKRGGGEDAQLHQRGAL